MNRLFLASIAVALAVLAGCLPATRRFPDPSGNSRSTAAAAERLESAYSAPTLAHERRTVLQVAESWLGVPYAYGGNTRDGVDCSGFVCNVFGAVRLRLPRSSAQQAESGMPVALAEALPGDLVFFNTSGSGVSHVGIIVDGATFVHASTSAGVIVSGLDEAYYRDRIVGVRRVLEGDRAESGERRGVGGEE